jgi:DNA-binding response OmpR family regulator
MAKTILIVDDDPNILDTARDILEDAGYAVFAEVTGAGALAKLSSSPADLALFDFNLPDTQGIDLAVKAKKIRPKMAIFLMTGEAGVDLGAAQGAVDLVLTKPVNPVKLLQVIQARIDS